MERQVEVPVIHEVVKPCLKVAPVPLPAVPAPTLCMEGHVCFTTEDAAQLIANVETLLARVRDDWTTCGQVAP